MKDRRVIVRRNHDAAGAAYAKAKNEGNDKLAFRIAVAETYPGEPVFIGTWGEMLERAGVR